MKTNLCCCFFSCFLINTIFSRTEKKKCNNLEFIKQPMTTSAEKQKKKKEKENRMKKGKQIERKNFITHIFHHKI